MGLCSPLRAGTPTLNLLSSTRKQRRQRHPAAHGAGHDCPAPLPPLTWPPTGSRTRQQRPHQSVSTNQASGAGAAGQSLSHHPQASAHTKARKHHKRTRAVAQTPNPTTHRANTPTTSLSKHAPKRTQASVPTPTRVGTPSVSAGTRVLAEATGQNEAQTHDAGTQDNAHKSAQTTLVCASVRLRPQGRTAREKAAHNSPRQGAWVVVFVGVFADVCRRFEAVGFGGLGVFWGCLACFLVF